MNSRLILLIALAFAANHSYAADETQHTDNMQAPSAMATGHDSMRHEVVTTELRDPHAYSNGHEFRDTPRLVLADQYNFGSLLANQFEVVAGKNTSLVYDMQGWFGRDYQRAVIKAEGDIVGGGLEESRTELLWSRAIANFWDAQFGVRYDTAKQGPNRSWLALGIQGLAPYWFELDTTFYVGSEGRTGLRLEAEYELLLTQKLILQPLVEVNVFGKDDPERGLGAGVSGLETGLRLRYEFSRQFAPYIGVDWVGTFGDTADYARTSGESTSDTRALAGLRFWF